jgi:putative peptide zinc metalloprotease protein
MYLVHGVSKGIHEAFFTPGLLLLVFALVLVSIIVHEFGHASALRYGGGRVGGMGVGFYLMYPAFYTDTTDSYRLGRWGRVRTDLGGFYFHLIFALGMIALAAVTRHDFLLFVAVLINADLVRQLLPFARFDGYWALVDLTGMPDFFSQMKPFLLGVLPGRRRRAGLPALKGWVKAVFLAYTLVTIPVLIVLVGWMLTRLPTLAAILSDSLRQQAAFAASAFHHGNHIVLAASLVQILLLAFEVVGLTHLLYVGVARPLLGVWNRINPLPPTRRAATVTTAAAFCLGTVLAFPQVLYTPGRIASNALALPNRAQVHAQTVHSPRPTKFASVPQAPLTPSYVGGQGPGYGPATSAVVTLPSRKPSVIHVASSTRHAKLSVKSCLTLLRTHHFRRGAQHGAVSTGGT